jgi:hypothetical protein
VQIENLLNGLEQDIEAFKSILPRVDDRRALLNVAGSFFKILFRTATVMDLEKLHNSVQELHERQEKLVYDVDNRMTYMKTLDASIKFNMQDISVLSEKMKRIMLDSQKWADHSKTLLHWMNSSIYNQTTIFTGIRQLEFDILQLQREIQNFMMGLEGTFVWQVTYYFDSPNYFIFDFE